MNTQIEETIAINSQSNDLQKEKSNGEAQMDSTKKLEGESLKEALKRQIEYYFSKENLVSDRYLLSQMNSELFVPIKTIANFKKISSLTTDLELIINVMRSCSSVSVDDTATLVKPNLKTNRNVVILRDIPSNSNVEDIRSLFANPECGKVVDIRSDIGDSWYITFENDDVALKALEFIRTQSFKGQPIKARIKTEAPLRPMSYATPTSPTAPTSTGPSPSPSTPGTPPSVEQMSAPFSYFYPPYGAPIPQMPHGQITPQNWMRMTPPIPNSHVGNVVNPGNQQHAHNQQQHQQREGESTNYRSHENSGRRGGYRNKHRNDRDHPHRKRGQGSNSNNSKDASNANSSTPSTSANSSTSTPSANANSTSSQTSKETQPHGNTRGKRSGSTGVNVPQLNSSAFPPLPSSKKAGYNGDYQKWSKDEIVSIISNMKDVTKPDGVPNSSEVKIVKDTPNTALESNKPYPKKPPSPTPANVAGESDLKDKDIGTEKQQTSTTSKTERSTSNEKSEPPTQAGAKTESTNEKTSPPRDKPSTTQNSPKSDKPNQTSKGEKSKSPRNEKSKQADKPANQSGPSQSTQQPVTAKSEPTSA